MKVKVILKEYLGIKNFLLDFSVDGYEIHSFKNIKTFNDYVEIEFYETEEHERLDMITINRIPIKHIEELKIKWINDRGGVTHNESRCSIERM